MTFPETLRELARLRPEKFSMTTWNKQSAFFTGKGNRRFSEIDQDDIDSIMAELGWEYEVRRIPTGNGIRWTANCFVIDIIVPVVCLNDTFPSKLSAARAALTAVVEELKKGEKGCRKD